MGWFLAPCVARKRVRKGQRIAWSVGLAVGTLLLLLAGTGAAFADREPGAVKGRMSIAEPQAGDRAVYSLALLMQMPALQAGLEAGLQHVPGGYDGPGPDEAFFIDANARMVVERAADRLLPDPAGGLRAVSSYVTLWSADDIDWSDAWGAGAAWGSSSIDAEPWKVVHTVGPDVVAVTLPAQRVGAGLPGQAIAQALGAEPSGFVTQFQSAAGPCGFHSDLQGRSHELSRPVRVHGACPPGASVLGGRSASADGVSVLASGRDDWQGRSVRVFAHTDDAERLRLWFHEDVAYPVRMLTQILDLQGQIKFWLLYELTQWTPGTGPEPSPPTLLPLAQPRQPWGPNDAEAEHPFPLSAAWQAARDDGALADFLAAHPDAQADGARFVHWEEDEVVEERWTFTATDGRAARAFDVTRRTAPLGAGTIPAPLVGLIPLQPETTVIVESRDVSASGRMPPMRMPDELPGVVPALQRWEASHEGTATHPAWAFSLCDDCDGSWVAAGAAQSLQGELHYSFLGLRLNGGPAFLEESDGPYQVPGESSPDDYGAAHVPDSGSPGWNDPRGFGLAYAGIGVWSFPEPETAATVGFAAAFIGFLTYLLSPLVKGGLPGMGAIGLFSRIGRDEVLDHPLRSQIVGLVEAEPGLHFQELARRLDTGRGTLEHHLRKLVAADLLSAQPSQGFTCYFPKGKVDRRIMAAAPVLKSDGARLVLQAIANEPGRAAQDVATTTGLTPSTVNYHLKRLSGVGLVETIRRGRFTLLTPTSIGQQALGTWSGT